jgi:sugar lactone lactonase YvrE
MGIEVYEDYVYWANKGDGTLMRAAITGTQPPEELFNAGYNPWAVAVDDTRLFWTDILEGTVRFMAKTGGPAQAFETDTSVHRGIAISDDQVFWSSDAGALWGTSKINPTPSPIISGLDQPEDLRYSDNHVYWTDRAQGSVNRIDLASGNTTALAVLQEWPMGIALDEEHVYWTTMDTDAVRRVPKDGGAVEELANNQGDPFRLTVDSFFVYWTSSQNGQVLRMLKTGGDLEVVAQGLGKPSFITSTETHLYWSNRDDGTVVRIQK